MPRIIEPTRLDPGNYYPSASVANISKRTVGLIRYIDLTRLNTIAIQARAQMDADKEAVGLSRVHIVVWYSFITRQDGYTSKSEQSINGRIRLVKFRHIRSY